MEKFSISESESLSQDQWKEVTEEDQQQDYSEPMVNDHEETIDEEEPADNVANNEESGDLYYFP